MSLKTKKNAGEFFEIGDLVVARRTSYKVRRHVSASPTQNRTTLPRSNNGLFWFYRFSNDAASVSSSLSAVIVDSYFLDDKRELFVCFFPSGEYKPFGAVELTLIQKGNKTTT